MGIIHLRIHLQNSYYAIIHRIEIPSYNIITLDNKYDSHVQLIKKDFGIFRSLFCYLTTILTILLGITITLTIFLSPMNF